MSEGDEFTVDGETYYWGPRIGAEDLGMAPKLPKGIREEWAEGPELKWEIWHE